MENFSIIILFHNNQRFHLVLDSIIEQIIQGDEIIIVNDHSDEQSTEQLTPYLSIDNLYVLNAERAGNRSYNRNLGAEFAHNPLLLFVDGDMVLLENCMQQVRLALESEYVGAFGVILQGGDTPEQMNLKVGFDYLSFLEKHPKVEDFYKLGIAYDRRIGQIAENIVHKNEWQFYYSGYCAARKSAFLKCGKFNETFKGWGAEDVEFGYRLEKTGEIKFLSGAYAFHISHNRDLFSILQNNKKNLYQFFQQQTNWITELYLTFHLSTNIIDTIEYIKNKMLKLNLSSLHRLESSGEISILPISNRYPNGNIAYIDEGKDVHSIDIMGLSMPFNDNEFDCANLTTDIFCYPELISAQILQECYRISKSVKIHKATRRHHPIWDPAYVNTLTSRRSTMDRTNYHASFLNDFTFLDKGEFYIISGGIATRMPYVHIDNLPNIYSKKEETYSKCILFDLTDGLSDEEINQILLDNKITTYGVYKISTPKGTIRLSELIYGELQLLNVPFYYVVDKERSIDTMDLWWNYKNRHQDHIIYHV